MPNPSALQQGVYYYIFNRGTNRENLFREDENYRHFLRLYAHHIEPVAETFAYCLMTNHFHLLIQTREMIGSEHTNFKMKSPSQAFANFFTAYTRAFNKRYSRTGSLFEHPFHRIAVGHDTYFAQLIAYIHRNPSKHGFTDDFREWKYSSYQAMLTSQPTQVSRQVVLKWFDGLQPI